MVSTLLVESYELVTPAGKPVTVAPVAEPPSWNVVVVIALFIQRVCACVELADKSEAVALSFTTTVDVAAGDGAEVQVGEAPYDTPVIA